jgi:hypothetical protein
MNPDLPLSQPTQVEPARPAYPILGLTFEGDHETISRLQSFAAHKGVVLLKVQHRDDSETLRMPPDRSVVDPATIAIINEAQSGRLGKVQTTITTGPPPDGVR